MSRVRFGRSACRASLWLLLDPVSVGLDGFGDDPRAVRLHGVFGQLVHRVPVVPFVFARRTVAVDEVDPGDAGAADLAFLPVHVFADVPEGDDRSAKLPLKAVGHITFGLARPEGRPGRMPLERVDLIRRALAQIDFDLGGGGVDPECHTLKEHIPREPGDRVVEVGAVGLVRIESVEHIRGEFPVFLAIWAETRKQFEGFLKDALCITLVQHRVLLVPFLNREPYSLIQNT